jgi:hypothetical protein
MASTHNKNTPNDYCLEQRQFALANKYSLYENGQQGQAYTPAFPCIGYMPNHMPRNTFSNNSVDIESFLRGTNSTNLVNPQGPVVPEFKTVPMISFFDRIPVIMPKPLVIENNQRPFPIPN